MKGLIVIPIIVGGALLVAGGTVFGIALSKDYQKSDQSIKQVDHEIADPFQNINIALNISNLEFKVSEGETKKVVCDDKEKQYHEVKVENNTLNIKSVDEREWYEKIFSFDYKAVNVTVYLPAGEYANLDIKSSTGNIIIPHDFSFADLNVKLSTGHTNIKSNVTNTLDIESSTGKVNVSDLATNNLKIKASTGDIFLSKVNVAEKLNVRASTGDIKMEDVNCQSFDGKTSTGNITFANTIVQKHVEIKTDTGDVKFVDSDAETLTIKTDTGNVTGNFLTSKIFQVRNHTGKPVYPVSTEGGLCYIETDTGRINIQIRQ